MSNIYLASSPGKSSPSGVVQRTLLHSNDTGERIVPASRRADGSMRKERKIRPGYTPPEDIKRYKPPQQRQSQPAPQLTDAMQKLSIASDSKASQASPRHSSWDDENWRAPKSQSSITPQKTQSTTIAKMNSEMPLSTDNITPKQSVESNTTGKQNADTPSIDHPPENEPESSSEKRMRALSKKIRQAQSLRERKDAGESLSAEEIDKIEKLDTLQQELSNFQQAL